MTNPAQAWWHPERFAARRATLEARGRILAAIRGFFAAQGFLEVETPALQVSPGLEPHLMAFSTELRSPEGEVAVRHLHTSPEFAMKKLLVAGLPRIFQLAHVFRNGERSRTHHPEFSMLEWYRTGATYLDLMADCENLLRAALAAAGAGAFTWQGRSCDPAPPWEYLTVAEAFERFCGFDVLATAPDPARPDLERLAVASRGIGIEPHPGDDWEDLFFRIFLDRIEPQLGAVMPTVLYDYPVSLAALSRPKPGDPRLAERFELYVCGLELANAFGELTDATAQRARFAADQARKRTLYGYDYPVDEDFLAALEHGMPDCAGIALGIDRLIMLAIGAASIDEVIWAPVM
ncbi:MAG: lysine aminoacylase GenX [Rhodospirillales bacterium]|jgi:lysyl-tRNA synthetase class 2|nr:lysine aminoacylase GenX [Rhodospirillales bacterium]